MALLEREVLLKKLRDVLESLKFRVGGKNKDEIEKSISMVCISVIFFLRTLILRGYDIAIEEFTGCQYLYDP